MSNKYQDWSREDLEHEANLINEVLKDIKSRDKMERYRTRKCGGVLVSDVAVRWFREESDWEQEIFNYAFYVKKEGKLLDVYYEWQDKKVLDHIPDEFFEASENSYEFDGSLEKAVEVLKSHGFTDIKEMENEVNH